MKYEIRRWFNGSDEACSMNCSSDETCFTAKQPSEDAAYGVSFEIDAPIDDTYIMVPACAYDGNRFETVLRRYPPMFLEEELGTDVPTRMAQVPHLKPEGDSVMDVTSGDLSVPCICLLRKSAKEGFILFFEQGEHGLNHGVTLEQCGNKLKLILRAPAKRRLVYRWYDGIPSLQENPEADPPLKVAAGEKTRIRHQVYTFPCEDITELYRVFFEKRSEHFCAKPHANLPFSAFWDIAQEQMNSKYFIEKEGFYSQVESNVLPHGVWQSGWVGGGMSTLSFLCDGNEQSRRNALRTLEFVSGLQSQAGWYYGNYKKGEIYHDDFAYYKERYNMVLVRKHADLTYFMFKQIIVLEKMGIEVPDCIMTSAVKAADALVALWKKYGQLGQFINAETGDIVVGNSASGGIAPAALCAAYTVTGDISYLECAQQIGEFFYRTFTQKGVTTGGPGEILQAPDSESAAGLLESFTILYELSCSGEQGCKAEADKWLKYACDAAHQAASWVVSYDYQFPKDCRFGKMGILTAGSVWANVQNKHSAPGLCTLSASAFLKLYRATGDGRYLDLMQQISHFMPQVVSYPQRPMYPLSGTPLGGNPLGFGEMCERVNMSDWEGKQNVGDAIFGPSNWPQAALMLTWTEIPGIYAVPSEEIVCVSDHVNAWMENGKLMIQNPTQMDARVKVLVEEKSDMKHSLGFFWQDRFRVICVKAGTCERIEI